MLTAIDTWYGKDHSVTVAIAFTNWDEAAPQQTQTLVSAVTADYQPGEFYKRELPPILTILQVISWKPTLLIIDGYVWLDIGRPGLGQHLYQAMNQAVPIIGVAKNPFYANRAAIPLTRGDSRKPLFITAAGIDSQQAAEHIRAMHGPSRIPILLKYVDRLSKESLST